MNLISCDECGVVLDKDKLQFPCDIEGEGGAVDSDKAAWNGEEYVPKVACPVCNDDILSS